MIGAFDSFAQIATLLLTGTAAVAVWFFRLWQGAKDREQQALRDAEKQHAVRNVERAARQQHDEQRRETEQQAENTAQEAQDGRTDHFESSR